MAWLTAAWRYRKSIGIGLIVVAGLAGLYKVYSWGYEAHSIKVERDNNGAVRKGIEGARSVRACADAGGLWDSAVGRCIRGKTGN